MKSSSGNERPASPRWSFLTNHARVLAFIASEPRARVREIASAVGVTERTAVQIVGDLERAGFLAKIRDGRRNRYAVDARTLKLPTAKALTASQALLFLVEALDRQPFS